jgi:hypothetical protein
LKGIVFCEFVEMMEGEFSPELADEVISVAQLPSGGAYTAVGTYDYKEMLTLVTKLSEKTGKPVGELVEAFGRYLFQRFVELYPAFFDDISGVFEFLEQIERHVHVEVLKLYPDASCRALTRAGRMPTPWSWSTPPGVRLPPSRMA